MKSFSTIALSFLLAMTTAAPLQKRDIEYFTVVSTVVVTIDEFTTIWVPAGDIPGPTTLPLSITTSTTSTSSSIVSTQSTASESSTAPILLAITSSTIPIVQASPIVQPPPPQQPSSSTSISTTTPAYTPPAYTPQPAPSSTTTPAPVAAPSATAPPAAAPPPAVNPTDTGTNSGNVTLPGASIGDGCTPGVPCIGDMTYYSPSIGMGACGPKPDGTIYEDSDMVVAVSHEMMGSLSNGEQLNALCWRKLHIFNPATQQTNTGMVVDKCGGCAGNQDIDLSPALYETLGVQSVGRYHGVQWYWE